MAAEPKKNIPVEIDKDWEKKLEEHRASIDGIDNEIIALLKKRLGFVKQVGELKHAHDKDQYVIRPAREATMARRMAEAFKGTDFNPAAAVAIWRQIIAASTSAECALKISVFDTPEQNYHYWTAREYFGSFNPIQRAPSARRVVGDVMDGKANVGILPLPQLEEADAWWPLLIGESKDTPRIFAYVPFSVSSESEKDRIGGIAISKVKPEDSGRDITFLTLRTDIETSQSRLSMLIQKCNLKARWVSVKQLPDTRLHLIELTGFYSKGHAAIEKLLSEAGPSIVDCTIIGSYAEPIILS